MSYVRTEDIDDGIRVLRLCKPERLNAIDFDGVRDAPREVRGYDVDWDILYANGQLPFPPRIRINLAGNSQWYTFAVPPLVVQPSGPKVVTLTLTTDYLDPDNAPPAPIAVLQTSPKATCEIDVGFEMRE